MIKKSGEGQTIKKEKGVYFMIEIPSKIEGKHFKLYKLEQLLKPLGFTIGGNWDYDHGSFDYKLNDEGKYEFLRLPFHAIDGQLDSNGATVEFDRPFVLAHVYQIDIDESSIPGAISGAFDQFAKPIDKDGIVSEQFVEEGKKLVEKVENLLLSS